MKFSIKRLKTNTAARRGFEMITDSPDVRMRIRGRTPEELFRNALQGVASIMAPGPMKARGGRVAEAIMVRAVDINSLLVEFLSETLARADGRDALFTGVVFRAFGEDFLEAELAGAAIDDRMRDVRAISYQDVDIKKSPETGFFETDLILEL